jgi:YggT family protein
MRLLATIIDLYSLVVLAAVVVSWLGLDHRNAFAAFVYQLTEPALGPIRNVLPPIGGLDFSPMVLLLLLRFLRNAM